MFLGNKKTDSHVENKTHNENRRIIYDAVPVNTIKEVSKKDSGVQNGLKPTLR